MDFKHPFPDESTDKMVGETLYKALYRMESRTYKVCSYTPVEGYPKPLCLHTVISREEADAFKERNWIKSFSTNTAALEMGMEKLAPQIPVQIRKLREGELVQSELEQLEGFGSF